MSIWQTKEWGEMLKKSGQVEKIFECDGLQIEKRKISLGRFGLFIIGIEEKKLYLIKKNKSKLKVLCKNEGCVFIQIETINYEGIKKPHPNPFLIGEGIKGFKKGFYKKFITPYTAIINLEKDEEKVLSEMKPKGRYNIKLASKKGVIVKEVEKIESNIKIFYNLLIETTSRNNFMGNKFEYYFEFLKNINNSKLLLAYYEDKIIAGGIFIIEKNISIYYYGASTSDNKYRNLMAPFLLQWEAIKIAKSKGSKIYDFLGISSPNEKNSSLAGVTNFKLKLTKDKVNVSNSFIWINYNILYFIIKLIRKLK